MSCVVAFSRRIHIVCGEYHRYWLKPGTQKNPFADAKTRRLMDLKEVGAEHEPSSKQLRSLNYFGRALAAYVAAQVEDDLPLQVAIVPPHVAESYSAGLDYLVQHYLRTTFSVLNTKNLLRRHTTVPRRSAGGALG